MKLSIDQKKVAILAELNTGASATELAIKYDVNPMTIGSWRRKQRLEAERVAILEVETVDADVVASVVAGIKEKASDALPPKQYRKLDAQLDKLQEGVTSLQMLDTAFHNSMMNLLEWANDRIQDDMKVSEWTALVNGISVLHNNMFGKGANTNVNIINSANVGGSSAKVEKFKASFRN